MIRYLDRHLSRRFAIPAIAGAALAFFSILGPEVAMAKTAEPPFDVTAKDGDIEVRRYQPMVVAEVEMSGDRDTAINAGFRVLANYIFGANTTKSSIDMTAPVTQQSSQKIAMTAPVTQQAAGDGTGSADGGLSGSGPWKVRFVMPEGSTLATLPKPNDARVKLIDIPAREVAAIRFSGWSTQSNLASHREKLLKYVEAHKLTATSSPVYAFYDPPWTLPFWRRNEVMMDLNTAADAKP